MRKRQSRTLSVPEAGLIYYGLKSDRASYKAAARGDIPVIRVGKLLRVPIDAMEAKFRRVADAA